MDKTGIGVGPQKERWSVVAIARETDRLYQQLSTPWGLHTRHLTHNILTLRFITKYSYEVSVKQFYSWGSPQHKELY